MKHGMPLKPSCRRKAIWLHSRQLGSRLPATQYQILTHNDIVKRVVNGGVLNGKIWTLASCVPERTRCLPGWKLNVARITKERVGNFADFGEILGAAPRQLAGFNALIPAWSMARWFIGLGANRRSTKWSAENPRGPATGHGPVGRTPTALTRFSRKGSGSPRLRPAASLARARHPDRATGCPGTDHSRQWIFQRGRVGRWSCAKPRRLRKHDKPMRETRWQFQNCALFCADKWAPTHLPKVGDERRRSIAVQHFTNHHANQSALGLPGIWWWRSPRKHPAHRPGRTNGRLTPVASQTRAD